MVSKFCNILCVVTLSTLLVIKCSTSSPLKNEKLEALMERFDTIQTRVDVLEDENKKLKSETAELKTAVKELEVQNSQQNEELVHLKSKISNLESFLISTPKLALSDATNLSSNNTNFSPSLIELSGPPSSCQKLKEGNGLVPMNGIHLLKINNKIQAAFCKFPLDGSPVYQELVGNLDVKTKSVHFYAQRKSRFGTSNAVIPFDYAPLNEGGAFNLTSGFFTAPVKGIYQFQFSGVKAFSPNYLVIFLRVNDIDVTSAYTDQGFTEPKIAGSYETVSLIASLRLAAGDRVNLWNWNDGVLHEVGDRHTQFSGWLVEEDLM